MTARIRITRFLPGAFATLTRAFVLIVLVGVASVSTVHAHQTEAFSSVAVHVSGTASLHECCHVADQGAQDADCVMSMCCSLSALAGHGGRNMPLASASIRPLIGPTGFASRSHPPILHPPIAV